MGWETTPWCFGPFVLDLDTTPPLLLGRDDELLETTDSGPSQSVLRNHSAVQDNTSTVRISAHAWPESMRSCGAGTTPVAIDPGRPWKNMSHLLAGRFMLNLPASTG
jgi:hypothetical protein